jgi:3D (Asp-Asp-Asp) domain-containing protein
VIGEDTMARRTLGLVVAGLTLGALVAACNVAKPPAPTQAPPEPAPRREATQMQFEARAYSIEGKTATGTRTHEGIVAADPALLPLGTRIRVTDAGRYSGEYVVHDTGRTIKGREIDIYLADDGAAKRFGRKSVRVEILK